MFIVKMIKNEINEINEIKLSGR
jgi:hypothetical protein